MLAKKPILCRVETYILPESDNLSVEAVNEIGDIKSFVNRLKIKDESNVSESNAQDEEDTSSASRRKCVESARNSTQKGKLIGIRIVKSIANQNEIMLDEQLDDDNNKRYNEDRCRRSDERLYVQRTEFQPSVESQDALYPVRQFKRMNSLMSIDERSESSLETKVTNFCHHGYKNGCTATIPSPEEVSEEVFKENWLQKIDVLRRRDAALREREIRLQNKERDIFRREKELRIAERVLKDKIRQLEQQLKHQKNVQVEKRLHEAARILCDESVQEEKPKDSQFIVVDKCEKNEELDKKIKCSTHPKSYSLKRSSSSNTTSGFHTYASIKYKERPKISYDDLNSTLSADVGDSSFVRTSELFKPELYKKPYVFTRSASERWPRQKAGVVAKQHGVVYAVERPEHVIEEQKVFQKLSENICTSQDEDTKFQNYGLVDCKLDNIQGRTKRDLANEEKSFSYLNLEVGEKYGCRELPGDSKSRPISWNEETDEWLQKKRQAYNLAIKQSVGNKENLKCNIVAKKDEKSSKKVVKNRILNIFR